MNNFKVWDWVRVTDTIICGDVVIDDGVYETTNTNNFDYSSIFNSKEALGKVELWNPKPGEWCWFYSKLNDRPYLDRFSCMDGDRFTAEYWHDPFEFCEPFIGELPNFCKMGGLNDQRRV
jgi:hypothetical protein